MRYAVSIDGKSFDVEMAATDGKWRCQVDGKWRCQIDGREIAVDFVRLGENAGSLLIAGKSFEIRRDADGSIFVGARRYEVFMQDPRSWRGRQQRESKHAGPQKLKASMPGKIVRILAHEGDDIQAGQGVVVVEAMKMQNEIRSPRAGKVQKVLVREGTNVNPGEVLAIVE